jgi:hypothetical protein
MKGFIISLCICLLFPLAIMAQTSIVFEYDDSGNRVKRTIFTFKMSEADSTLTESGTPKQDENPAAQRIAVYPNPTDGLVNIDFNLPPEPKAYYVLTAINGAQVEQGNLTATTQTQLNLMNLGKGTYILHVVSGDDKEKFKIVKQ